MDITPSHLLAAYAAGYFPMARSREDPEIHWFSPEMRGILPLDAFHVPRRLARFLRTHPFEMRINTAFSEVIAACAAPRPGHAETWINPAIEALYTELWRRGYAHSVECWREGKLAGGIYGVALGGAFFGESMFSRIPNASKAALVFLAERLRAADYLLFDTQYVNPHLLRFGALEIPRADYLKRLETALAVLPQPFF